MHKSAKFWPLNTIIAHGKAENFFYRTLFERLFALAIRDLLKKYQKPLARKGRNHLISLPF
jgi:hypothetical protein